MTNRERTKRMQKSVADEYRTGTLEPYFLYFSDPDAPAGQKFLGACIVEAHGFVTAILTAHRRGINPGGAVYSFDVPAHDPSMRDRLITSDAEMATLGYARKVRS